jgi:hypothetical protein
MPKLRLLPIEGFKTRPIFSIFKVLAVFFIVSVGGTASAAQFGQSAVNGAVEAVVKMEREQLGDSQRNYDYFAHRYRLNTRSFVVSPRLLIYQIGLTLEAGEIHSGDDASNINNFGYNARTTLFPDSRINASLYANKESVSNFTPMTSRLGSIMVSQTNTMYGVTVNIHNRFFPMTIDYNENQTKGEAGIQQIAETSAGSDSAPIKKFTALPAVMDTSIPILRTALSSRSIPKIIRPRSISGKNFPIRLIFGRGSRILPRGGQESFRISVPSR